MNVRPILFSAPMVRALLAGSKTQTRRVVKPQPVDHDFGPGGIRPALTGKLVRDGMTAVGCNVAQDSLRYVNCPYGEPGDLLYVRESGSLLKEAYTHIPEPAPGYDLWRDAGWIFADGTIRAARAHDVALDEWMNDCRQSQRPSIHMPRWASRLTLRITGVRVQQLQDISDADAKAEGAPDYDEGLDAPPPDDGMHWSFKASFMRLWESINGANSWAENPWVWAVGFEVIQANVDQVLERRA